MCFSMVNIEHQTNKQVKQKKQKKNTSLLELLAENFKRKILCRMIDDLTHRERLAHLDNNKVDW